jgi:hypothetical protein
LKFWFVSFFSFSLLLKNGAFSFFLKKAMQKSFCKLQLRTEDQCDFSKIFLWSMNPPTITTNKKTFLSRVINGWLLLKKTVDAKEQVLGGEILYFTTLL